MRPQSVLARQLSSQLPEVNLDARRSRSRAQALRRTTDVELTEEENDAPIIRFAWADVHIGIARASRVHCWRNFGGILRYGPPTDHRRAEIGRTHALGGFHGLAQ